MKRFAPILFSLLISIGAFGQVDTSLSKFWMMTYFVNGSTTDYIGPRLAFSSDTTGLRWQIYGNTSAEEAPALFTPVTVTGADGKRCRDPMTVFDSSSRKFHMVWTTEWTGKVIGYDTSALLKPGTWGPQMALAVGTSMNASFSWAPEVIWDDIQNKFMLYWSVSVSGKTTRIYYSMITGSDFKTFSAPEVLFDPGYNVIDANIIKVASGNFQMFFKDERDGFKYVRRASGATKLQGPYPTVSGAISGGTMEGPTVVYQGGEYHAFIDRYGNQGIHRFVAKDIETKTLPWGGDVIISYGSAKTPLKVSHCNIIEVPKTLVKWMLYNDSTWVKWVKIKPDPTKTIEYSLVKSEQKKSVPNAKVFDLTGRLVGITNNRQDLTNAKAVNLPAGFYATQGKNKVAPVAK